MQLRLLPTYSTERYYILSEIEQRATIAAIEGDEGKSSLWSLYVNHPPSSMI